MCAAYKHREQKLKFISKVNNCLVILLSAICQICCVINFIIATVLRTIDILLGSVDGLYSINNSCPLIFNESLRL
jgi:hypothetical protein